jgi:hypothetical protein
MSLALGRDVHMKVLHTPGHSPGSCSFLAEGVLLSGDAVPVAGEMPIYDDHVKSIASVRRLRQLAGVNSLCMSWAEPTTEVQKVLSSGQEYLERIEHIAAEVQKLDPDLDDEAFCRKVLDGIGMRATPALPLIARSLRSHRNIGKEL